METIKVNMSPNPLDVQTIHASQNDGEARQWGFELHNNGDVIDASEISDQLVFKAYKGGTEQILPENGSVPTTSPIIADIKYPHGELTDQEFLYRQSPTEEDGLAKITDIKGNTLVWNQLNQNGNYVSTSGLTTWGCTISASNNILTFKATNNSGNYAHPFLNLVSGHKYLVEVTIQKEKAEEMIRYGFEYGFVRTFFADNITTKKRYYQIVESTYTGSAKLYIASTTSPSYTDFGNVYVSDYVCFDLTQMDLDISSPSDFTSLFSLPYYDYNQGSLLSFNGNGIKTVGKNLLPPSTEFSSVADITINADNGIYTLNGTPLAYRQAIATNSFVLEPGTYRFSKKSNAINNNVVIQLRSLDGLTTYATASTEYGEAFTINDRTEIKFRITVNANAGVLNNFIIRPMLELGSTATSFEPYTSSTLSLPISTYFPTGMKSAGSVYDELTESKAITRVGSVTYNGGITSMESQNKLFILGTVNNIKTSEANEVGNLTANGYTANSLNNARLTDDNYIVTFNRTLYLRIKGITTVNDANTYLASNPVTINYELATPTETSFTTASLVTENAEIPLSNNDGVLLGKCTEQLSENPGFIDAKIKLADADGECYSNKLQLHVERSPQ